MTTKVKDLVCYLLFRLLLPVTLLAATVVRFNGLSFLYLIFLLISILLSSPSPENIKGLTGLYLKLLIVVGALGSLAQAIFHIVLRALATDTEPYGYAFPNCSTNEKIARQIGVERLDDVPVHHVVRLVAPDAAVLIVAILVFVVCYKLLSSAKPEESQSLPTTVPKIRRRRRFTDIVLFIGEFLVVLFLAAGGIVVPSVISAIYFLSFLGAATWWSFYKRLGRGFAFFRTFLLVWNIVHILVLYLYQFQFFQEVLPPDDFVARLLGLTGIIKTDCDKPWSVEFHDVTKWPYFVNPAILFVLYIVLAVETRHWKNRQDAALVDEAGNSIADKSKKRRQRKPLERQVLPSDSKSQTENLVEEGDGQSYNTFEDTGTPTMYESDPEDVVDGNDETEPKKKLVKRKDEKRSAMVSIFVYVMKQSYVLSLIAMMAWSITFHSWLTFVLLLVACIIWMIPKSRKACLTLSPVILFYGEVLLIIQFIYGLDLTEAELPSKAGDVKLNEIGLKRFPYPCLQLGLQIIFTATFWLTMRQFMRERRLPPDQSSSGYAMGPVHKDSVSPSIRTLLSFPSRLDSIDGYDSNTMKGIGDFLWTLLAKYWIFVCAGMMLLISLQDVVIYRIIYLIFVLYFFLSFQLWYSLWRITMKIYWWCVIIYSMAVLIMLYTYQFSDFPSYWKNGTGLADETIHDIGLEMFDTAGLFVKLLTPTSFLILIIIQVHYFHRPFLVLSDLDRYKKDDTLSPGTPLGLHSTDTEGNTTDTTDGKIMKKVKGWRKKFRHYFVIVWNKCSDIWGWLSVMLWRIAEIHMFKVVAFTVVMVSVYEVSALTAVYIILLCILMPIPGARMLFSHLAQFWTGLVMLSKMIYQLRLVEKDYWISNCTADNGTIIPASSPFADPIDNAKWVGFDKTNDLGYYLRRYIAILLIIAFERIVIYHQRQHFNASGYPKPNTGIIFPETKRRDADKNIKNCLKFFANYFFYKYGLEICYIMSAITISVRVDVYSLIYAIFLGILLLLSRRGNARIWPLYTIILAVLLPVQFLLRLGFPLGLCIEYPWDNHSFVDRNLEKWLFLPDYEHSQNAIKFVADFFQLLFVCLQWQVFRKETSDNMENYGGGDNQDILPEVEGNTPIPVEDFTSSIDSYLDVIKFAIFVYLFWVTLFIVFITGTARINIFSMGYVIAVFCFMWYGQEFILLPLRKIRKRWCMLVGYTYFVLLLKAALQLLGCVYINALYEHQCWLIQLLGLTCLNPSNEYLPGKGVITCEVEKDDTGLMWDVICFTFLLLQLRIYNSQYFRHVVASAEAQSRLASRGAELINSILIKDVLKQKEDEKIVLYNIKKKMEVLKKKQAHKKKDFIEPDEHFQAIRSGDYFLFDEESDKEEGPDTITLGRHDEHGEDKADPLKLITTALDSGTKAAVDKADDMEEKKSLDEVDIKTDSKGASCDAESEEEEDSTSEKDSIFNKVKNILTLIIRLLESFADWLIEKCNNISRKYRLVARKLEKEMRTEKEKIQAEKQSLAITERTIDVDSSGAEDGGIEDDGQPSGDTVDLLEVKVQPGKRIHKPPSEISLAEPTQEDKTKFDSSKPKIYLLLEACYYVIISRSELVCYFLMVLDQILNASLLSLPLPLMVFLWGMLSVPRPSKTFWITVITYTEAVVVVKYLFQFNFFPWNDHTEVETSPFWPPRILGIEKRSNYAAPELVLLLALFIHRSILKRYGLWKDAEDITADYKEAEEIYMSRPASPVNAAEDDADVTRSIEEGEASTSKQLSSIEESGQSSVDEDPKKKKKIKTKLISYVQPLKEFYKQLTNPIYNATTDVYAPMFACDFIGFLIVVFGYWAFGPAESGSGDVSSYISENKIPVLFLVMLVTLFVFIIIDRALYLRKNVLGKFIFQIFLVIFIHIYMFFILPAVTGRKFSENKPAQLLYFIKCVYFGLSAYQIRSGYPTRILGNFLTKKYNYLNLFLFKGFLAIPFLLELRVLMDWIWTDSTLAIGSWLTMEDIYANIYILKCWREAETKYPTPRGFKKRALIKYGLGGVLLVAIIFIIWFPLVIFSFANTVFNPNPPIECTVTIAVGGFQPLFKMTAQTQYISQISTFEYNTLKNYYSKNPSALGFLDGFEPRDISLIRLNGRSSSIWGISPPSQKALVDSLTSNKAQLEFYMSFSRIPSSGDAGESLSNQFLTSLHPDVQQRMADMVNGTGGVTNVTMFGLFPRFIHLGSKGRAEPELVTEPGYSNISLSLKAEGTPPGVVQQWWEAAEVLCGDIFTPGSCNSAQNLPTQPELTIVTFNDRVAPQGFSFITGYGIIGLYISIVIVVGRFIRVFVSGQSYRVMFEELPNVDNILNLCMDIYLVRECGDFRLEEDLFAKLLFVFRCPEILIRWTKYKRE